MELEDALFFEEADEGRWPGSEHSDDEHAEAPAAAEPAHNGVDIAGTSIRSGSIQSSTLRASLHELHGDADAGLLLGAAAERPPRPGGFHVAASLPARTSAVQMGSSVPIAIPRWKPIESPAATPADPGAVGAAGAGAAAGAKFVPPHQLTRQDDFTFSFNGASPSGCLKRERLRTRNAVLRSTGFLEPKESGGADGGGDGNSVGGVAHSLPAGGGGMLHFEQRAAQQEQQRAAQPHSSLTAALSTIGES